MLVGVDRSDLDSETHVDVRVRRDTLDEVARHGLAELLAADGHRDARAGVREARDGLARGVAGADHDEGIAGALRDLAAPGAVVGAAAEQLLEARRLEPPPDIPGAAITTGARTV